MPSNLRARRQNNYTYGPVPSRRLGYSLGIDIVPHKKCSFDCIYCQLGSTTDRTLIRKPYTPVESVLAEIRAELTRKERIDYLTFSGSGEPTLHSGIGYLIRELKKITEIRIAVLTNGSLLYMPAVRKDLLYADVVIPTLCTTDQDIFRRIHRSHPDLDIKVIIDGYIKFRKVYSGEIWLELMLVKGINDRPEQIDDLKKAIARIDPERIHLNTVIRPPSEEHVHPVSIETMQYIKNVLGDKCEIIADFKRVRTNVQKEYDMERIATTITRRPVTIDDLVRTTGLQKRQITEYVGVLLKKGRIESSKHGKKEYYKVARGTDDRTKGSG